MSKYIGAKWLGLEPIETRSGIIMHGGILKDMPEAEAKERRGFEPVYESEQKQSFVRKAKEE